MNLLEPKTYDEYRTIVLNGKKRKVKYSSFLHPDVSAYWIISLYDSISGIWEYVWWCKSIEDCDKYIKQREKTNKEMWLKIERK